MLFAFSCIIIGTLLFRERQETEDLKNAKDIAVLMVWLGDKLANMRAIYREWKVVGDKIWQKFNQKDKSEQAWYYTSIVNLTSKLSNYSAWIEYKTLTELVFNKGV